MAELIRRGEQGMEGVLRFTKYFVEKRGVSANLFEGKLTHLLCASEAGLRCLFVVPERSRKTSTAMMSLLLYIDWCLIT
jgi:hypothetical protein